MRCSKYATCKIAEICRDDESKRGVLARAKSQVYELNIAGLEFPTYFSSMLSICLSIYGLASYMVDEYDIGKPPRDV